MAILTDQEVRDALSGRPAWRRVGDTLVRERALRDFSEALQFLERIGQAVEDWGRHPDIAIAGGNRVRVIVSNANGAGFTDAELRLVEKVDEVADAPVAPAAPRTVTAAVPAPSAPSAPGADGGPPAAAPGDEAGAASPARGGRAARVVAGIGGIAVGAAAVVVVRRR